MGGEDRGRMSGKARRRVPVMRQALEQQITPEKRLLRRVEQEGDQGRVHRGRGKPSNRGIPAKRKATVLTLYEERDGDGGPTLATEKLAERDGITLSDETLRRWLRGRGMDHVVRRKRPPRA
ncbi:MAG: transposase, partial [Nitrospira sp. WS110]|nr:transposase [Nitrospira sp. WS110]